MASCCYTKPYKSDDYSQNLFCCIIHILNYDYSFVICLLASQLRNQVMGQQ